MRCDFAAIGAQCVLNRNPHRLVGHETHATRPIRPVRYARGRSLCPALASTAVSSLERARGSAELEAAQGPALRGEVGSVPPPPQPPSPRRAAAVSLESQLPFDLPRRAMEAPHPNPSRLPIDAASAQCKPKCRPAAVGVGGWSARHRGLGCPDALRPGCATRRPLARASLAAVRMASSLAGAQKSAAPAD